MREASSSQTKRRARIMLGVGAAIGIMLAAAGAFAPSGPGAGALPTDAIARVNKKTITTEEFARAMALLTRDKGNEITDEDRARVLNGLIDEELLVQRGIEMGIIDSDRAVRKAISTAMIQTIVAESSSKQPSEDDLRAFYEDRYGSHNAFLFEQLREQVEAAYIRSAADKALRDYLDWLWEEAEITLAPEARR